MTTDDEALIVQTLEELPYSSWIDKDEYKLVHKKEILMSGFLKDDYKVPSQGGYMKLKVGENRFRILGSFQDDTAIMGMEYWTVTSDGKRRPVRVAMGVGIPVTALETKENGEKDLPKHFWAMPVWNYADNAIEILEITQKSIMQTIKDLSQNKKWGNPGEYDLVVTKSGEGLLTKYSVQPDPKEELSAEIKEAQKKTHINIVALFSGEDPFGV